MFSLIVARGYPAGKYPSLGIFEFDQAKALHDSGCKVVYCAVDLRSIRRFRKWGTEHFFKDGIEIYAVNIPLGRVPHGMLKLFGQWGLRTLYRKILKDHGEPDVIHAHFLEMAEIALTLKKLSNAKLVMTEHSSAVNCGTGEYKKWIKDNGRAIYGSFDKVIAVSDALAERILENFGIQAVVVNNMLGRVFLGAPLCAGDQNGFTFVFTGNFIGHKNPLMCIDCFYHAFRDCDFKTKHGGNIRLKMLGDGPLLKDAKKKTAGYRLKDNILLLGYTPRNQVALEMSSASCFVLPSKGETFGVAYIEAMACGLPVIAARCGGPESFVKASNGLLIPVDDADALTRAFRFMPENAYKYDPAQIAKEAREKFSPQNIARQIMGVYEKLIL